MRRPQDDLYGGLRLARAVRQRSWNYGAQLMTPALVVLNVARNAHIAVAPGSRYVLK